MEGEPRPTRKLPLALLDANLARRPATSLVRTVQTLLAPAPQKSPSVLQTFPPAAQTARLRPRHAALMISFAVFVLLPVFVTGWYLFTRAADQYASTLGFSVRKEEASSAIALLGGITNISGSSSADTDILYDYMHSQKLVAEIDESLDLRRLWSKPTNDPVFTFDAPGTIETLVDHWTDQVRVTYDSATRLIEIRVLAFDPDDAQAIATALFDKSTAMINRLNDGAQADALRFANAELAKAETRLRAARGAITDFRNRTQSIDPATDMQSQAGLLANLQTQLAEALIDADMLAASTQRADTRGEQAALRITVIEARIAAEREKLGLGATGATSDVYASMVGEYERLSVDREFAETAYRAAQLAYDAAGADARRQTLYLAAHIAPTRAESAQFPQRQTIFGTVFMFLFLAWAIAAMVYYSIRDRR